MAPGRRRGSNKAKANSELSLGDLVLAKVKGFPAWPAKISRPEDWEKLPDPKKFFVQFFGTEEIAFVAPADIQAFTNEVKIKLSARCQGKTKHFSHAVQEICAEFDELQKKKSSGSRDDTDGSDLGSGAPLVDDGVEDGGFELDLKGEIGTVESNGEIVKDGIGECGSKLERCSQIKSEVDCHDVKPSIENCQGHSSSQKLTSEKKSKTSAGSGPDSSCSKEELSTSKEQDSQVKDSSNKHRALTSKSHKLKVVDTTMKKKYEGAECNKSNGSSVTVPKEGSPQSKDGINGNFDSVGVVRKNSSGALKSDSEPARVMKSKDVVKSKKHLKDKDLSTNSVVDDEELPKGELTVRKKRPRLGEGKTDLDGNEILHKGKKTRCREIRESKGSLFRSAKSISPSSNVVDDKAIKKSELKSLVIDKNLTSAQSHKKRRAVCLFDEEDEEEPKTPIHGGSVKNVKAPSNGTASKSADAPIESSYNAHQTVRETCGSRDNNLKESSSQLHNKSLSPNKSQVEEKSEKPITCPVSDSQGKSDSQQLASKEAELNLISLKKSPMFVSGTRPVEPQHKVTKATIKVPSTGQKKAVAVSSKASAPTLQSVNLPQVQDTPRSKFTSSGEKSKTTPKSTARVPESSFSMDKSMDYSYFSGERLEALREDKGGSLIDSKTPESVTSMKHLIAVAQAKRKQAHTQNLSFGFHNSGPFLTSDVQGRSPSPSLAQPFVSSTSNVVQTDIHGSNAHTCLASPSTQSHQLMAQNKSDIEELEERRFSSVHRAGGDSLSGGTEAAVARDAFEGMIETLSRTKESIGRATRLAIECAKYGIANEVVELLIRKLENEHNFHRKVDLFFLVDSITQCSHTQRGIAGASYIPIVQAALPRLLGGAAPPGTNARENRRQCHKVLRLWLERKILPESILRRYMDDIGVSNDDTTVGFTLRRPSRSERAIDDPIREMEGMLVDEYGSNATFQLPGFLSSHVFEDEDEDEDFLNGSSKEVGDASPVKSTHANESEEACAVTPIDRRHCILEDVDGELEMEDVSGHPKDEKPSAAIGSLEMDSQQVDSERTVESVSHISELSPVPEGSPPLPLNSPSPLPPLPSSPPPPPPPLSPSPPPPPPSQPPPLFPPGPPPLLIPQNSVPTQPSLLSSQQIPTPQSSVQSSPHLVYQVPLPHEYRSGNQPVQMVGNTSHGGVMDATVRNEALQQSPCFVPASTCNSREPSTFSSSRQLEYGRNDVYLNAQVSQPNQLFQQSNPSFVPRPLQPAPPPNPSSQFSYANAVQQQHPHPHPYHNPYPLPPFPDGRGRFVGDEQWRTPSSEFKAENQHGAWMNGVRAPLHTGPPFGQEGYYRPPVERPPANNISFHPSTSNNLPSGVPIVGHGIPHMLPSRPDMSALNCWRPV